ncbi:MAG: M20/M25/M40 family metallo-hydrolase [Candidatus Parcubacteria bacterium]|nr:M20/M25/M40 family metallo-hydrolase [Candidatus Parcubacteria bacterium]
MNIDKDRLVRTFCELAQIESPAGSEKLISEALIHYLQYLNFQVTNDAYGNLIARRSGYGEPIMLCAHMDTVPKGPGEKITPVISGGRIRSDGTTILGADNKDSIAAILEALTLIKENCLKMRTVEIVFTREEEAISLGAKNLDLSLIHSKKCIIADAPFAHGSIIQSAPFNYNFDITIKGRRAHVSKCEEGLNAFNLLLKAANSLTLGKVDEFTRLNLSFAVVGLKGLADKELVEIAENLTLRNTVPDFAIIHGEVRGPKIEVDLSLLESIKAIFSELALETGAEISFSSERKATGYFYDQDDPFIRFLQQKFGEQGVTSQFVHTFGGSDANILVERGINAVVIGSPGRNPHCLDEYLEIKDLELLTDFYLKVLTAETEDSNGR